MSDMSPRPEYQRQFLYSKYSSRVKQTSRQIPKNGSFLLAVTLHFGPSSLKFNSIESILSYNSSLSLLLFIELGHIYRFCEDDSCYQ